MFNCNLLKINHYKRGRKTGKSPGVYQLSTRNNIKENPGKLK